MKNTNCVSISVFILQHLFALTKNEKQPECLPMSREELSELLYINTVAQYASTKKIM